MSEGLRFRVFHSPHTFRGASRPHGFKWCLRYTGEDGKQRCHEHGLIFGEAHQIVDDLPEPFKEWMQQGAVPLLPADRGIGHLALCHVIQSAPEYIRPRPKRPTSQSPVARRIYFARLRVWLRETKNTMIERPDDV